MPLDPALQNGAEGPKPAEKITRPGAASPTNEQNMKTCHEPSPADPAMAAPPRCWQLGPDEPPNRLCIYGPEAAVLEAPPPDNPEPPEPDEDVGETLTERQLAFCEHYVERPVAALAARAAGYAASTAGKQASRLLKHPLVMRRILELRRKRHLEHAYRRETLIDKFEIVFAEAIERKEFYAAIQALTMQARLARIEEASPSFRYVRRFDNGAEHLVWDALTRLEQKLSEIAVGDFPGAASAVPAKPFAEGAAKEARKLCGFGSAEERAARMMARRRKNRPPL
jgi:phage terminase small subunit